MKEKMKAFMRQKDLKKKTVFTLLMLLLVRFGSQLQIPGVNRDYFGQWFSQQNKTGAFNIISAFTGGSFERMSVFALNITPYITASIIIELLTIAIPSLEEMQRDGENGRKKMTRITRYLTAGLALMESVAMAIGFWRSGLLEGNTVISGICTVVTLVAGAAFVMWIGELINDKGIGNGISIVLLINIISSIPQDITGLFEQFVIGKTIAKGILAASVIIAVIVGTVILTVVVNDATRKIPVNYAPKSRGSMMSASNGSSIPLKVNTAGVIPVIFASSLFAIPQIILSLVGKNPGGAAGRVLQFVNQGAWFRRGDMLPTIGFIVYCLLIIFFAYFYTSITFNPIEVADNLRKQGATIPGIRAGQATTQYLQKVLDGIIFIGALMLIAVVAIPAVAGGLFNTNVSFGGTSLIIIVGVVLETIQSIEAQLAVRTYKGFLG